MTPSFTALSYRGFILQLPQHDYEVFTYVAAGVANDDNVATVRGYRTGAALNGTDMLVGTLTFTYVGATNNVALVTLTLP